MEIEVFNIFFYINCLLLACIVGIIFVGQGIAPLLCKFYLKLIILANPRDASVGPIIFKNLETHGLKNMKANLMYSIIITFLVFTQCNFK
jgi:hypothetical protein